MAKRKIIWSNTAVKKLYSIFEADIRKSNNKEYSAGLFKTISERIRLLKKYPFTGMPSSDPSVRVLVIGTLIVCYGIQENIISIYTVSEFSDKN